MERPLSDLLVERQGAVTIFTINRPDRRNAFTKQVMANMEQAVADFNADPSQLVAILTGAGDKAFCAGGDLGDVAANAEAGTALPMSKEPDIGGLAKSEKPIIAAINGLAVAGGMEMALLCDIRIAAEEAWFGLFEVSRGFVAGVAAVKLARMVPIGVAMDLMLAAERMSAAEALRLGLVQQVVPADQLMAAAMAKAEKIAKQSPTAVWGSKKVLRFWHDALLQEQQRYYEAVIHRVLLSGDMHEGPRAFMEKREPQFNSGWPDPLAPNQK